MLYILYSVLIYFVNQLNYVCIKSMLYRTFKLTDIIIIKHQRSKVSTCADIVEMLQSTVDAIPHDAFTSLHTS